MLAFALLNFLVSSVSALPFLQPRGDHHWVSIFSAAPAPHEGILGTLPSSPIGIYNGTDAFLVDTTVRQTHRVSQASQQLRLRITNRYGVTPLDITAMTIALPSPNQAGSISIDTNSVQTVTFEGNGSVSIPGGADWVSDPIYLTVVDGCEVSVSTYLAAGHPKNISLHSSAENTAFYTTGDFTQQETLTGPDLVNDTSSYFVFTIEGWVPTSTSLIACIGDSITDGYQSTIDSNGRYPDQLSDRLNAASGSDYAVVNLGISGNRVLTDAGYFGDSLLSRVSHDLFSLPALTHAILLEGINDINTAAAAGTPVTVDQLTRAYQQFITEAHIRGIAAIGATLTPYQVADGFNATGSSWTAPSEQVRQGVNDWIRSSGAYDYVVDFDEAVRNSTYPEQMQVALAASDFLHPNNAGYAVMAAAFDLSVFDKLKGNVNNYD